MSGLDQRKLRDIREVCTSCDACTSECPVAAIYAEEDVPAAEFEFIALNAEMAAQLPPIVSRKTPLANG